MFRYKYMQLDLFVDGVYEDRFVFIQFGVVVFVFSLSLDEGLFVFVEFQKVRQCFVLENEFYIVYLVSLFDMFSEFILELCNYLLNLFYIVYLMSLFLNYILYKVS